MAGLGDLSKLMKQAQKLQKDMATKQEELAQKEVEATSGGGMVTVVARCDQTIKSVTIDPEVIDPNDPEMLQDLIVAAVNEAMSKCREAIQQEMAGLTGGLNLPGMF